MFGLDTYDAEYKIEAVMVHPKYDGNLKCGFNIAVCILKDEKKCKLEKRRNLPHNEKLKKDFRQQMCGQN